MPIDDSDSEWLHPIRPVFVRRNWLTRIGAAWGAAMGFLVPIGYEDEAGFHYGEEPAATNQSDKAGGPCWTTIREANMYNGGD